MPLRGFKQQQGMNRSRDDWKQGQRAGKETDSAGKDITSDYFRNLPPKQGVGRMRGREIVEERMGSNCLMGIELSSGAMKIFWNWVEMVVAQYCECTKCH